MASSSKQALPPDESSELERVLLHVIKQLVASPEILLPAFTRESIGEEGISLIVERYGYVSENSFKRQLTSIYSELINASSSYVVDSATGTMKLLPSPVQGPPTDDEFESLVSQIAAESDCVDFQDAIENDGVVFQNSPQDDNEDSQDASEDPSVDLLGASATTAPANLKIPRPPNAFICYRRHFHPMLKERYPDMHNNQICKCQLPVVQRERLNNIAVVLGKCWRNEEENVKDQYRNEADEAKRLHQKQHPEYLFQPRKYSEKKHRISKQGLGKNSRSKDVTNYLLVTIDENLKPATTLKRKSANEELDEDRKQEILDLAVIEKQKISLMNGDISASVDKDILKITLGNAEPNVVVDAVGAYIEAQAAIRAADTDVDDTDEGVKRQKMSNSVILDVSKSNETRWDDEVHSKLADAYMLGHLETFEEEEDKYFEEMINYEPERVVPDTIQMLTEGRQMLVKEICNVDGNFTGRLNYLRTAEARRHHQVDIGSVFPQGNHQEEFERARAEYPELFGDQFGSYANLNKDEWNAATDDSDYPVIPPTQDIMELLNLVPIQPHNLQGTYGYTPQQPLAPAFFNGPFDISAQALQDMMGFPAMANENLVGDPEEIAELLNMIQDDMFNTNEPEPHVAQGANEGQMSNANNQMHIQYEDVAGIPYEELFPDLPPVPGVEGTQAIAQYPIQIPDWLL